MLNVDEALSRVLEHARTLPPALRSLPNVPGLVLAEDIASDIDMPPFTKALMDGFAVRATDVTGPGTILRLGEVVPAGRVPFRPLASGEAATIMTGAPLPDESDAVVPHERTEPAGPGSVRIDCDVTAGMNLMPRGQEMRAGDRVLDRGTRLRKSRWALGLRRAFRSVGDSETACRRGPDGR